MAHEEEIRELAELMGPILAGFARIAEDQLALGYNRNETLGFVQRIAFEAAERGVNLAIKLRRERQN